MFNVCFKYELDSYREWVAKHVFLIKNRFHVQWRILTNRNVKV